MTLSSGCNHVALVTQDLDRLIGFYSRVFEAEVVDLAEGPFRHAMIDLGAGFCLHPFEFTDPNPHQAGSDRLFDRGHLDHLAINVDDADTFEELRSRLVAEGATDGELTDFGTVRTVWFEDPDGMGCEITIWSTNVARTFENRIQEPYIARF